MTSFATRISCACAFLVALGIQGIAHAADADEAHSDSFEQRWARKTALWGHAGYGPFGVVGVSFEYAPIHYLPMELGVGVDFDGPRAGFWPRVRIPFWHSLAIGAGASISVGDYNADDDRICFECHLEDEAVREWHPAIQGAWLLDIEGRVASGFVWRVYVGQSRVLNEGDVKCTPAAGRTECFSGNVLTQTQLGTSFGYAFE